jgi:hypothetical protein
MREPTMIKYFKTALLYAIPVAAGAIAAYAADPTPPQTRPQVAMDPGLPYSSTRIPGPKAEGSTWISSAQYQSAGFGRTEEGEFYAKKGFGPPTR